KKISNSLILILALILLSGMALGQTNSLTLSSGAAPAGGSVSLNLTLSGSPAPAGLEWMIQYSTSDISAVSVAAGPARTPARKTLNGAGGTGSVICLLSGMTSTPIANDVVAVVTFTLTNSPRSSIPLTVTGPSGVLSDGTSLPPAVSGATIAVPDTIAPTAPS